MKSVQNTRQYGLDSLELKALSVPSSLRFLLGIEYDVVLCVNEVGTRRPFRLHFPVFAPTFRKLLGLCATRFCLECTHGESESVLSGTAVMPLLRYADYLPGALHVKEILECLQVEPAAKAKKWQPTQPPTQPSSSSLADADAAAAAAAAADGASSTGAVGSPSTNEFAASFIDYAEFASDSSLDDVHGLGFYLLLDYGLSLATHSHLVGIRFHKDWDATEALREFQEFSGWSAFDLRFLDEQRKQDGGVIVMPSSQDACDLLERYEDEDSDDEGDLLPFILRPVSPLVSVPSLEDSALRKLRDQHWAEVERHWTHVPRTLNTVVVYNLYEGATLQEILSFFEPLPIVSSEFVEDDAPTHRRRAFVTFASLDATRKALDVDGKNTRGCTLRVQVSPPYISPSRRGHEVKVERPVAAGGGGGGAAAGSSPKAAAHSAGKSSSPAAALSSSPPTRAADHGAAASKAADTATEAAKAPGQPRVASAPAGAAAASTAAAAPQPVAAAAAVPSSSSSATRPVNTSAAIAGAIAARAHAGATFTVAPHGAESSAPIALPAVSASAAAGVADGHEHEAAGPGVGSATSSHGASHMNAAAKEFVPHFHLSATSPEYHPAPPPSAEMLHGYGGHPAPMSHGPPGAEGGRVPPSSVPPPPPAYGKVLSPAMDFRPTPRSAQLRHGGMAPNLPSYALPPPYIPGQDEMEDVLPPPPPPFLPPY